MRKIILIFISVLIYTNIKANDMLVLKPSSKQYVIDDFKIINNNFYIGGYKFLNASKYNSIYINATKNEIKTVLTIQNAVSSNYSTIRALDVDEIGNTYTLEPFANTSKDNISIKKINSYGDVTKEFYFGNSSDDLEFRSIKYNNGFIYTIGTSYSASIILKLDSNLNKIWCKEYYYSKIYYLEGFYFDEDKIITVAWDRNYSNNYNSSLVQSINLDGEVLQSKANHYNIKNYNVRNAVDMIKISDEYLYFLRKYEDVNIEPYLVRLNTDFSIKTVFDVNLKNSILDKTMAEDKNNFYLVSSNQNQSYIHSIDKKTFKYNISYIIKDQSKYKINKIKMENNSLQILGYINNTDIFALSENMDQKCFLEEINLDFSFSEAFSTESFDDNVTVKNFNANLNSSFSLLNNDDISFDYFTCSTPCGDGSEFDSKVSSLDKFELNNSKLTEIDSYLMTDEKDYFSHGALSHIEPIYVSAGFSSEFAFKIDKGYNDFIDGSLPGADGFSLIFHTDNQHMNFKSDQYGGGMGFHNRKNAIALEIDLYNNDDYNDPDGNHIAFQVPKDGVLEAIHNDENTLGINSNIPIMKADGQDTYYCKLEYKDNNLKVWIDKTQDYGNPAIEIDNFKFSDYLSLIEHSKVYVSLVAVTGTSYQKQEVFFWDWCSYYDPISSVKDKALENNITIYPNPSSDMIYIDGINSQENIELFDLTGRLILQQNYNNGINISELNRGIYILNIYNQNYKIIKE